MTYHMRDESGKDRLHDVVTGKRDQLVVIAWCVVYTLVIAAIDWIAR